MLTGGFFVERQFGLELFEARAIDLIECGRGHGGRG
jgi:hypothetical protein